MNKILGFLLITASFAVIEISYGFAQDNLFLTIVGVTLGGLGALHIKEED